MKIVVTLAVIFVIFRDVECVGKLQERFRWKELDFEFPNPQLKQRALNTGSYIPRNGLPVGIEHWGNKLFVSVPRWKDGKSFNNLLRIQQIFPLRNEQWKI